MRELALIAAVAKNGVIGKAGGLPWRLPEDLKRFKAMTTGHAVIMGRKTFDEIRKPLPNRRNLVVTSQPLKLDGCEVFSSLEAAIDAAYTTDSRPFVIGGSTLYAQALPFATHLFLTHIEKDFDGDTVFPHVPWAQWKEVARVPSIDDCVFVDYERR